MKTYSKQCYLLSIPSNYCPRCPHLEIALETVCENSFVASLTFCLWACFTFNVSVDMHCAILRSVVLVKVMTFTIIFLLISKQFKIKPESTKLFLINLVKCRSIFYYILGLWTRFVKYSNLVLYAILYYLHLSRLPLQLL